MEKLDDLLEDLYAFEPSLRARDAEMRTLARELMAARPEAPLDGAFVARLRAELLRRAPVMKPSGRLPAGLFGWRGVAYAVPGLAVVALAVTFSLSSSSRNVAVRSAKIPSGIERLGTSAFGALSLAQPPGAHEQGQLSDGAVSSEPTTAPSSGSRMHMPVEWTSTFYTYLYKGEPLKDLPANVDVYRRLPASVLTSADALRGFGLGLLDLGRLQNASLQSFSIAEDRTNGYVATVDATGGTVNVYQNDKWGVRENTRLQEGDMLSDEETIRVADAFLDELGISREGYGAPTVRNDWRSTYAAVADKAGFWFPDTVSVVYPYLLDSKPVADDGGAPYGLEVNVDVALKRATGLSNLAGRRFQASSYPAETDAAKLIAAAERGGLSAAPDQAPPGSQTVTIELGTPIVAYTRAWQWDQGRGSELFAPALIFPLMNAPKDFWAHAIVIPLAKDLFEAGSGALTPKPLLMNK